MHNSPFFFSAGSTAVVFLHGISEIWYSLRHQMVGAAAAGYRAIAPDLRSYGFSEPHSHPQNASFEDFVEDIVGILDFLHIPTAFLVGKDFGSWVAYLFSLSFFRRRSPGSCLFVSPSCLLIRNSAGIFLSVSTFSGGRWKVLSGRFSSFSPINSLLEWKSLNFYWNSKITNEKII